MRWRFAISALAILTALLAYCSQVEDAQERGRLATEISKLRTVAPLRKEAADLAKEILEFNSERDHYMDQFKPGQIILDQKGMLKWYHETVSLYHQRYETRVVSILDQIRIATGMDVAGLQKEAKAVNYEPEIEKVGIRLGALAASLP